MGTWPAARKSTGLARLYRGLAESEGALFIRHLFSMSNWLESYAATAKSAHLVLDPDVSPYGLLQAAELVDDQFVGDFLAEQGEAGGGHIDVDVSRLRRTWETSILIVAYLNKKRGKAFGVRLHVYDALNEKGLGRDNTPCPHQVEKFEQWYHAYQNMTLWSDCDGFGRSLELENLEQELEQLPLPTYAIDFHPAGAKSNVIVGHSKWYAEAIRTIPGRHVRLRYAGHKKVKYATADDPSRIDNFVNKCCPGLFRPCGLTYSHALVPRGRCCKKTANSALVHGKPKRKPGSAQVTSIGRQSETIHMKY